MRRSKVRATVTGLSTLLVFLFGAAPSAHADFILGEPENLGPQINGTGSDACPFISADGLTLYWGSFEVWGGGDLWFSTRPSCTDSWGPKTKLGPVINSQYGEGFPVVSDDGLTMYFASNRPGSYGWLDIYVTTRATVADPWREPANLGLTINDVGAQDGQSLTPDGLTMYFVSCADWPGSQGDCDIWVTTRPDTGEPWEAPVNLGPAVNSAVQDWTTCLSRDGRWLFFGSMRSGGYGDSDLWVTRRQSLDAPWEEPVNLGPMVNTRFLETTPHVSADNSSLLFGSERPGGMGDWDIWQAPIKPVVDFNGDGEANDKDVGIMREYWGKGEFICDIGPSPLGDGIVDLWDLEVLVKCVDAPSLVVIHEPRSDTADVSCYVALNWMPTEIADTHDVYFGTVFEFVNTADRDNPLGVLVSQGQGANTYDPMGLLKYGQTYYWRVDEVSASPESAIHKGFVWNFTTEPIAYALENVTAVASASEAGAGPENTVNGSGLNGDDEHSIVGTDMWLSTSGEVDSVWIQYEFDKVYRLHEMLVWNYNVQFELALGFGLKDVTVEYSGNGTDWKVLGEVELTQATATATYTANTTVDLDDVIARYVRLTVNNGWGMMGKYGLSEVRFFHIPTRARKPQPADGATGVSPDTILRWHAGREAALHEIYLSTDRQAVVDGTALVDTVAGNNYLRDPLDPGQTYYWKINEINEAETVSVWEGDVWEFTTAE